MLIALISNLFALEFEPANGFEQRPEYRDSLVYYHNNHDDQHWYGAESWAVKFSFNHYFNLIDSLQFTAQGALVFFPNDAGSDQFSLKLTLDDAGQPSAEPSKILFTETGQPTAGWNIIDFDQTFTDSTFWLVLDYPTNSSDQFVSASATDGSHSYFQSGDYYYNMLANNYASEFLFSLRGNFDVSGIDLDLAALEWTGALAPEATISPKLTVTNYSQENYEAAYCKVFLETPETEIFLQYLNNATICDSFFLPELAAETTYSFDISDSLGFILPRDPAQFIWEAEVYCGADSFPQNNALDGNFNLFTESRNLFLIENALRIDDPSSDNILQLQADNFALENIQLLNLYFDPTDLPFFCLAANHRFSFYDLFSYPATIFDGSAKILGYDASYEDQLDSLYNQAYEEKSFVSNGHLAGTKDDLGNISLEFELTNENTALYNNFIGDLTIYYIFVEELTDQTGLPDSTNVPVIRGIVAETNAPQINSEETLIDTISFNYLDDVEIITDESNCCVLSVLQNSETKEIYHVAKINFDDIGFTSCEDEPEIEFAHKIQISPNPSYTITEIAFQLKNNSGSAELEIYNVKGQKVKSLKQNDCSAGRNSFLWDGTDSTSKPAASGIYLMKLILKDNDREKIYYRKSLKLKK